MPILLSLYCSILYSSPPFPNLSSLTYSSLLLYLSLSPSLSFAPPPPPPPLLALHRLDRLTSGLLLFARNLPTAQRLEQQIRDRQVAKEYVCKVHGEFPK